MPLRACPACACHIRDAECVCPHCGAKTCNRTAALPAAALLMGLALAGCAEPYPPVQAEYGVALEDADEDGFYEGEDCDDSDPDVHPDADETPGDDIDSNCDGEDDT